MMVAPPGEPSATTGLPCVEHDRRRHRRARPLAGARQVRVVHGRVGRGEGEVGQLVVEQEAAAGDGDAAAAGLLDGEGVRDDVAPLVGGRQMRGALALVRRRRGLAAGPRSPPGRAGRPARRGLVSTASSLIRHSRESANRCESSSFVGTSSNGGVADPAPAVGEGDPARLDVAVQVLLLAEPCERSVALQDVERLADASCRRRRTAPCRRRRDRGTSASWAPAA